MFGSRAVTKRIFFPLKRSISLHACATSSELPSNISTLMLTSLLFLIFCSYPGRLQQEVNQIFCSWPRFFTLYIYWDIYWDKVQLYHTKHNGYTSAKSLVSNSLLSNLNWFIHNILYSTNVLHLKVNIYIMNNRWFWGKTVLIIKNQVKLLHGQILLVQYRQ